MNQGKIRKLETIEAYVKGELSMPEIERLWFDLVREPDLYSYLETYANLYEMTKKSNI